MLKKSVSVGMISVSTSLQKVTFLISIFTSAKAIKLLLNCENMENWETLDLIIGKWYLLEDGLKSVQIIEIIDLENIIVKPYNGEQFKVSQTAFCDYDEG